MNSKLAYKLQDKGLLHLMRLPPNYPQRHAGFAPKQEVEASGVASPWWMEEEATEADRVEGALEAVVEEISMVVPGSEEEEV